MARSLTINTGKVTNFVPFLGFILFTLIFSFIFMALFGNSGQKSVVDQTDPIVAGTSTAQTSSQEYFTELKTTTISEGTGTREAKAGDKISVHYTGTFTDGKVFDSSVSRGEPFDFTLGGGQVIEGWDKGIVGMKKGEKRKLFIPYSMAYGEDGYSSIPAKADLIFDVELVDFK